jgi:hypothetical protein
MVVFKNGIKITSIDSFFAITPSNSVDLPQETIAIYLGTPGDLKIDAAVTGTEITFKNLSNGVFHPIRAKRVYATGTSATEIIGGY